MDTEAGLQIADPSGLVPDAFFDRQWALAVMERALNSVAETFKETGKERQVEHLKPWLVGDSDGLSQAESARELDITPGALKVAIHRLRKRFREVVQREIAQTVDDTNDVEDATRCDGGGSVHVWGQPHLTPRAVCYSEAADRQQQSNGATCASSDQARHAYP